ncbi:MAG: dUTP diphosphatase [Desulfovibrionaceae bacterium]|nr:dUTP diphosphatase [Desulfovibrionaceae bacterium]
MNTANIPPSLVTAPTVPVHLAFVRPGARALYAQGQKDFLTPATALSAGFDLRACLEEESVSIAPGARFCVPVGISVQPQVPGLAGFVYSRSGLGAREGLTVAQGVGVIDPDYTGEILVMLLNTADQVRHITRGERVAQLVFQPYARPLWQEVPELASTQRGAGGFGHTGR